MHMTLRDFYTTYLRFPLLDRMLKSALNFYTLLWSCIAGFYFPKNYVRNQKWEMLQDTYEPDSVAVFKNLIRPGMNVVDLGAHIGYFTRLFAKLVGPKGRILAFEADPFIYALLKKNVRRLSNVDATQVAVSDHCGTLDFYHSEEKSGCGSTIAELPVSFKRTKISVPAADLDSLLEAQGIIRVDFIKMDIEGGEAKALKGMRKTLEQNPAIIMVTEFAPEWLRSGGMEPLTFLNELKSLRFTVYAIISGSLVPFDPKNEEEMKSLMPTYFMNICCKREG